jgi:hypothetical protein
MSVIITYVCNDYSIIELQSNSVRYCTHVSEKIKGGYKSDVTGTKTRLRNKKYYELRELSRMRWRENAACISERLSLNSF